MRSLFQLLELSIKQGELEADILTWTGESKEAQRERLSGCRDCLFTIERLEWLLARLLSNPDILASNRAISAS